MRAAAGLGLTLLVVAVVVAGCGVAASSKIADKVGASSCERTDIRILSPIDDKTLQRLYDCQMSTRKARCFIDQAGAIHDVTVEARELSQLESPFGKLVRLHPPSCVRTRQ